MPGTHLVKACLSECEADLFGIPTDFFHSFVIPSPKFSMPDKPLDITPGPVGPAAMAVAHHHGYARFLEPDGARPITLESKRIVDIEEEVASGPKGPRHSPGNLPQVRLVGT